MIPDNYDMFLHREAKNRRLRERLPKCEEIKCGRYIDDDYYFLIDGEVLCENCMNRRYRRVVEVE